MVKIIDKQCPGSDPTKKAVPQIYTCPECGGDLEIWSDEKKGRCLSCHASITRDKAQLKE